jgi:hypothetical protein
MIPPIQLLFGSALSTIVLEEDTEPMAIMVDLARRYQKLASFFPAAQTRQALGRARRQL